MTFSSPDIPDPPPPTPPPDTSQADAAAEEERKRGRRRKGRGANVLNSPTGAEGYDDLGGGRAGTKTLGGGA